VRIELKAHTIEQSVRGWRSASALATPLQPEKVTLFSQGANVPLHELANHDASSFEFLYCEGLVHRMPWEEAEELLKACFRVLKPFGLLRVTTIDIDRVVHGYLFDWSDDATIGGQSRTQRLNAAFRRADIVFLYGEEELTNVLALAGFEQVRRFGVGASSDERFWNMESDRTYSLILEASKA
jgi:predicted SAM-dependent methyltransferase